MHKLSLLCPTIAVTLAFAACATAPKTTEQKSDLELHARAALSKAQQHEPKLSELCQHSVAYAVFPKIDKGAVGVGGAYGKGVLFERQEVKGYCDMTQASIGLQVGAQTYSEILCFENTGALDKFKSDDMALDAQASAVALESGAGKNLDYSHGVAVVTTDETGLMAEASVGGQKFTYQPR